MERLKWWFYWKVLDRLFDEDIPKSYKASINNLIKLSYEKYIYEKGE